MDSFVRTARFYETPSSSMNISETLQARSYPYRIRRCYPVSEALEVSEKKTKNTEIIDII